jgi:hypothetical protein
MNGERMHVWFRAIAPALILLSAALVAPAAAGGADPNGAAAGVTGWALLGANPVFGQSEELRAGYDFGSGGWLSWLEPAVGLMHSDGLDSAGAAWALRGYLLAHALDASLLSRLIGGATLPDGDIYGGLYGQYGWRYYDWSAGWLVGGVLSFPSRVWQTVAEYDHDMWGERANTQTVVIGLRRKF